MRRLGIGAAFLAAALLLAWPLRHGAPLLDDYLFLALGRHLESPWPLLLQDSTGTYFFRPVVMGLWWASVQVLGVEGGPHLALDIAVHAANGAALAALLRRLGLAPAVAFAAGLVFVVHPTTFAAACWLSDRFDLFATLFGLLSLVALEAHLRRPSPRRLGAALALLALALFSKEVAFAFAACGFALALVRRNGRAAALITVLCVAALALRQLALRDATASSLGNSVLAMLLHGPAAWVAALPGALVVRHGTPLAWLPWLGALGVLVVAAARTVAGRRGEARFPAQAAIGGAVLAAVAVGLQSPVLHVTHIAPFAGEFHFESLAASRLFYVAMAGMLGIAAAMADPVFRDLGLVGRRISAAATLVVVGGLLVTSRTIAGEYVRYVDQVLTPTRVAATLVADALREAPPACKLYFLDAPSPPFKTFIDAGIKSSLAPGHPALGCLIAAEHTPWYNVVPAARAGESGSAPLDTMRLNGRPYPPLQVGNLAIVYLDARRGDAIVADPAARFFAWRGGRFVEVTGAVRSGAIRPGFHANR